MLLYRVLSALVGIPVILLGIWYGKLPLSVIILIISLVGILEMSRLWHKMGVDVWTPGALFGGVVFVVSAYLGSGRWLGLALFLTLAVCVVHLIRTYPSFSAGSLAATVFTPLYTGWLLTHLINIRQFPYGFHFVLLVLAATWSTDTFAYFVGINLGRRKLAPVLSPNKSVEGSIGGVAGSIIVSAVIGRFGGHMPLVHYIVIGVLVGIVGQAGDLLESALKRIAGVKDSGRLIPGHGGALDRFDSLFLTAPVVYYYLSMFIMN